MYVLNARVFIAKKVSLSPSLFLCLSLFSALATVIRCHLAFATVLPLAICQALPKYIVLTPNLLSIE